MEQDFVDGLLYTKFANQDLALWRQTIGTQVRHMEFGVGVIAEVDPRGGNPLFRVDFEGQSGITKLNLKPFLQDRIKIVVPHAQHDSFRDWTTKINPSHETRDSISTREVKGLELVGEQRRVLSLNPKNPIQIKGVAGSGKTTVAIFRARHLLQTYSHLFHPTNVVIFTFSKTLVQYLNFLVSENSTSEEFNHTIDDLTVTNFHKWAWNFLVQNQLTRNKNVVTNGTRLSFIKRGVERVRRYNSAAKILDKSLGFFSDEIKWIKGKALASQAEYASAPRVGRGVTDRVSKGDRAVIWQVYDAYQSEMNRTNQVDFEDYALLVFSKIKSTPDFDPPFTHVVVDEAQDLSKAQMLVLSSLVKPETNSITVIADAAQRIYKSGFTWSEVGLNVVGGRTVEFKRNYRNTMAIAMAAQSLLAKDPDPQEFTQIEVGERPGPKPSVVQLSSENNEREFVSKKASELFKQGIGNVCIVHRLTWQLRAFEAMLQKLGVPVDILRDGGSSKFARNSIKLCTMSSVKGLQFDFVLIAGVSSAVLPMPSLHEEDDGEGINTERRLLYTVMTRAKQSLIITFSGEPSLFLDEIDPSLLEKGA